MGIPARRPAAVVPAPPVVDDRAAQRERWPLGPSVFTTLTCPACGMWVKSFGPTLIKARSLNCAQAALIMAIVSAGAVTRILPKPKEIGGVPAAIQDNTSSSAPVGNSSVSAPTKGCRRPSPATHHGSW